MTPTEQLKRKILDAHARRDSHELARLQAQYRMRAVTTSTDRGYRLQPARLVGSPAGRPPARLLLARAAAVQVPWPRASIKDGARASLDLWDGREGAAWLIGEVRGGELTVVDVMGHGEDSTSTTVRMQPEAAARINLELPLDLTVIGDVHAHGPDSHSRASDQDLAAWAYAMDWLGKEQWLGLIAREVEHPNGWKLDLGATLLRREHGRVTHRSVPITTRSY